MSGSRLGFHVLYVSIMSCLTTAVTLALISFIFLIHSIGSVALSCSVTPSEAM